MLFAATSYFGGNKYHYPKSESCCDNFDHMALVRFEIFRFDAMALNTCKLTLIYGFWAGILYINTHTE